MTVNKGANLKRLTIPFCPSAVGILGLFHLYIDDLFPKSIGDQFFTETNDRTTPLRV
jgi:hypothetical protein